MQYREDLDKLFESVNAGPQDMVRIAAVCHPANGVTANWWPEKSQMVVACAMCGKPVVAIEAPSRPLQLVTASAPERAKKRRRKRRKSKPSPDGIVRVDSPQDQSLAARKNRNRGT